MSSSHDEQIDDWFVAELVAIQPRLFGFVASMVPRRADADDLVQKAALTAWQDRRKFDRERSFFAWVCGIARNHVLHYYRSQRRSHAVLEPDVVEQLAGVLLDDESFLQARHAALIGCLEKLPQRHRQLVTQFYASGQTIKQFAADAQLGLESMYKRLQRIRGQLLDCIRAALKAEGLA